MKNEYDVIIIGAGIGGLTCGCYLAKAGLKVIILDMMNKPGGYCSSYEKNGFLFDAGPHSFGSCRPSGQIGRLVKNLDLDGRIDFKRKKISNTILTQDFRIDFNDDAENSLNNLKKIFPKESRNIQYFFDLMLNKNVNVLYEKIRKKTFKEILDLYFSDYRLKSIIGALIGNLGLSPYEAAAFTSAILYREHIFDGGYYPAGGMQSFSNILEKRFIELGGNVLLRAEVRKIRILNDKVQSVITKDERSFNAKYVISNCDAYSTYVDLIENVKKDNVFIKKLVKLKPSPSFFVVHLGFKKPLKHELLKCSTLWYFTNYDIQKIHKNVGTGDHGYQDQYLVFGLPYLLDEEAETNVISLLILASYKSEEEWKKEKSALSERLIRVAEKVLPGISNNIAVISTSSPYDFYKYTYNRNGSISGWASTVSQINSGLIGIRGHIQNLFHVGHWLTSVGGQGGIPMVVYSGRITARYLLSICK